MTLLLILGVMNHSIANYLISISKKLTLILLPYKRHSL